jgi:imidazolonepropionase-like amidohydrolase
MPDSRSPRRTALVVVCLAVAGAAYAPRCLRAQQDATTAFVNARLIPITGPAIDRGTLVVRGGTIIAAGRDAVIPKGAQVVDLGGKVVMPGLVDSHSHIGGVAGADGSAPIQPDVRVLDAINVRAPSIRRALAGGITTANVMPGSGNLLSGQTVYLKLRGGTTIDDFLIRLEGGRIAGGLKMANGTNSLRPASPGPFPGTRAKSAALVREQFVKAVEYRDKVRKAAGNPDKMPPRDLSMEALVEVLDGSRTVHFHTHRHDDIVTVLRLGKEFGFTPVLQHASEAWKVADEIARSGAPCSIIYVDSPGGKLETMDLSFRNGAVLEKAGVLTAFHTDDYITDSRLFIRSAGLAARGGMSHEKALYALTMAGARMLRLDTRIGSLEPGKDADFVVLSGDPFSVYTRVEQTWVEGRKMFDLSRPEDHLIAVGGDGAMHGERLHADDEEDEQ